MGAQPAFLLPVAQVKPCGRPRDATRAAHAALPCGEEARFCRSQTSGQRLFRGSGSQAYQPPSCLLPLRPVARGPRLPK